MLRRRLAGLVAAAVCALAAGAQSRPADVGGTAPERPARRIVSLLPSLTELVCALGACDRLVGTDRYSDWPPSVLPLPKLGGIDDAQVERIVALHPDLVLAAPSERVGDRLQALGLRVAVLPSDTMADIRSATDEIAKLLGRPAAAGRLWQGVDAQIRAAAARVPAAVRGGRVYFEIEPTPYAAGPSSYLGELLTTLGMRNAVPARLGAFPRLNPEFVVAAQPDIVMTSASALATMRQRPGWSGIEALGKHRTCGFSQTEEAVLVRPGPRLGDAAELLAACLAALPVAPP